MVNLNKKQIKMKKVILLMALSLTFMSNAQLEVKETTNTKFEVWSAFGGQKIVAFIFDADTVYTFYYSDAQYSHITVIDYISFDNLEELNQFLDLGESTIKEKKEYTTDKYSIRKMMKSAVVYNNTGFFYLSLKNINKIRLKIKELNL